MSRRLFHFHIGNWINFFMIKEKMKFYFVLIWFLLRSIGIGFSTSLRHKRAGCTAQVAKNTLRFFLIDRWKQINRQWRNPVDIHRTKENRNKKKNTSFLSWFWEKKKKKNIVIKLQWIGKSWTGSLIQAKYNRIQIQLGYEFFFYLVAMLRSCGWDDDDDEDEKD